MGASHSPKLRHYWSLTMRLFSVISRIFVGGVCRDSVVVFYSPSRLDQYEVESLRIYFVYFNVRSFLYSIPYKATHKIMTPEIYSCIFRQWLTYIITMRRTYSQALLDARTKINNFSRIFSARVQMVVNHICL